MNPEELHKKFDELPENIQEALLAPETASSIYEVGKSVNLPDEKISLLAEFVGDAFMDPSKNPDLTGEVKSTLGVSDDIAKILSAKVDEVIKYVQSRPIEQITDDEDEEETEEEEELEDTEVEEENTAPEPIVNISPLKPSFAKDNESLEFLRTGKLSKPSTPPANPTPTPSPEVKQSENTMKVATVNITPSTTSQIPVKPIEKLTPDTSDSITTKFIPYTAQITPTEGPRMPVAQQPEIKKPEANIKTEAEPTHNAPFIMHKEEEVQVNKESPSPYSVQRPTFYKPVLSEEYKTVLGGNKTARVELGNEENKPKSSDVYKTSSQGPRVVHYSEFRTEVSPFGNQNQSKAITQPASSTPTPPPVISTKLPEVHPNNVIDLKDLPLK